jgi:DNA-binding MarR family transcriptional regulator
MTPNLRHVPDQELAAIASELRVVLGQLVRRLRTEHRFPLQQASVIGRLDREGSQSVSDLAGAERVRQQSMAQTVSDLEADGLVERRPDPGDRRRALVLLTDSGRAELDADRRARVGWLVDAIEKLSPAEQATVAEAVVLLRCLAES